MQEFLEGLKGNLVYIKHYYEDKTLHIYCETKIESKIKIHERQERVVKDLPFGEYKVKLHILSKRFYVSEENRKTISEKFEFINETGRRTKRLDNKIMACKAPGGSKKKYIYYQCNSCKTYIREDQLIELLVDEITEIIEYDSIVRKYFAPLLKHKITNTNELLSKELINLKDKVIRLKDAYLNEIISLEEYKEDKTYLENRIIDVEKKIKEEQELEQYNFTFEDIMLKRDIESIKCFINPFYELNFQAKWDKLSVSEKQELITSYIDSIEVIKNDKDIKIKHITFRKTFIEEYANIFNSGGINSNQEIKANDVPINIEVSAPMTREEIKSYIKKLQLNFPIDYQELKKEQINDKEFMLKYSKGNYFNEPFKLIPILDKFKITNYGLIEVPVSPINIINVDI